MKEVLPWLVLWACHAGTRDFRSALAALVGPVQNIFFLAVHFFNSFVPIAHQAGQGVVLGFLSLVCVSGYEFGSYIIVPDFYCTRSVLHRENCILYDSWAVDVRSHILDMLTHPPSSFIQLIHTQSQILINTALFSTSIRECTLFE
jgi:hypothetical protein